MERKGSLWRSKEANYVLMTKRMEGREILESVMTSINYNISAKMLNTLPNCVMI